MKVLIMPNLSRASAGPCTEHTIAKLQALGVVVLMNEKLQDRFSFDRCVRFMPLAQALKECDFVAAIGGDGTILHTAKLAVQENKPVFGINAGRLGFLAGLEADELDRLADLAAGNYIIEQRMMLKVTHHRQDGAEVFYALNDAVISKGVLAKIVDLDVCCDDHKLASYRADGIIFATPTGSTAYALSAGGPVIDPQIDSISMTPICSHSLMGRSIIFSDNRRLVVTARMDEQHAAYLSVDGEDGRHIAATDRVDIEKGDIFVQFVKLTDKPFFEILNEKIMEKMSD